MKKQILLLIALLIGSAAQTARADSATNVQALHITNLTPSAGKYINVFYLSAREAALGLSGQQLKVRAVLTQPIRIRVPDGGVVDVPATRVPRKGFLSFNYLYFAITGDEPNPLFLRNADDSPLSDPRLDAPDKLLELPESAFAVEHTGFISLSKLQQLPHPGGAIQINSMKDIQQ